MYSNGVFILSSQKRVHARHTGRRHRKDPQRAVLTPYISSSGMHSFLLTDADPSFYQIKRTKPRRKETGKYMEIKTKRRNVSVFCFGASVFAKDILFSGVAFSLHARRKRLQHARAINAHSLVPAHHDRKSARSGYACHLELTTPYECLT